MTRSRVRRKIRLLASGVALVTAAVVLPPGIQAQAATTQVNCDTATDDSAAIQAAINGSGNGDTVALSGTCDLSGVPAHGGGAASVGHAAVFVGTSPISNLTISSSSSGAIIKGSGTQAAIAIGPDAVGTKISGLQFHDLGRSVVVLGADNTTVGAVTSDTPDPTANRILANIKSDSQILAIASDVARTVSYGQLAIGTVVVTPGSMSGLTVAGNAITYHPPGVGSSTDGLSVVAIDVRQRGAALASGIAINHNAVGMFGSEFNSAAQNGIRIEGDAVNASSPTSSDFGITGVSINNNNLGWFELLPAGAVSGVDANDLHAAGRIGVLVSRAHNVTLSANQVRARMSAVGNVPGGGIVVGDSMKVSVLGNDVNVIAPGEHPADLGAIGVLDGVSVLFGDVRADQAANDILVRNNKIGIAQVTARRGVVVSGADMVTVANNEILSSKDGLFIGADISNEVGSVRKTVSRSVLCTNRLNGKWDDPYGVTFVNGTPASVANNFPAGSEIGGVLNAACAPGVNLRPSMVVSGSHLEVSGRAWASRSVVAHIFDDAANSIIVPTTAGPDGNYYVEAHTSALSPLADGKLHVKVVASDPSGFSLESKFAKSRKDFTTAGQIVYLEDGGDGVLNATEVTNGVPSGWIQPPGSVKSVKVWWSGASGVSPSTKCGPFSAGVATSGEVLMPPNCAQSIPEGVAKFNAQWTFTDNTTTPVVSASAIKDTVVAVPVISTPVQDDFLNGPTITMAGTGEPGATVYLHDGFADEGFYGQAVVAPDGSWTTDVNLVDGSFDLTAYQVDAPGNYSSSIVPLISFTVDSSIDVTPPPAPVIVSPLDGDLVGGNFFVTGTSEPHATVAIRFTDGAPSLSNHRAAATRANESGNWIAKVTARNRVPFLKVHATAIDFAGNESGLSNIKTVDLDGFGPIILIDGQQTSGVLGSGQQDPSGGGNTGPNVLGNSTGPFTGSSRDDHSSLASIEIAYYKSSVSSAPIKDNQPRPTEQTVHRDYQLANCNPVGCMAAPTVSATFSEPRPNFESGTYIMRLRATDSRGNVSFNEIEFTIRNGLA